MVLDERMDDLGESSITFDVPVGARHTMPAANSVPMDGHGMPNPGVFQAEAAEGGAQQRPDFMEEKLTASSLYETALSKYITVNSSSMECGCAASPQPGSCMFYLCGRRQSKREGVELGF